MSVHLFIRVPNTSLDPSTWIELEWAMFRPNAERIAAGVGTPEDIEQLLQQNGLRDVDLTLLVPAQATLCCRASIPAKQARYIQQALPYAVEENVAQDIESMHLTASRKAEKGFYQVLGVPRERMQAWYDFAKSLGYPLKGIYPDAMSLPYDPATWSLCFEGDNALLRPGHYEGLTLLKRNLYQFLELKTQRAEGETLEDLNLRVFLSAEDQEDDRVLLAELAQITGVRVQTEAISISPFELLCESFLRQSDLINLCQGEFQVKNQAASPFKRWMPALGVAAAWFVIQLAINLGTGIYYQRQAEQYSAQARTAYLSIFPNERRVADIRRSLEGKLRSAESSGGGVGFLGLLTDTGYQLSQQPNRKSFTLRSINYNRQRAELVVELQAGSFDQLDRFKQALVAGGYNVEIGSAINEKDGVRSRLSIRGG